MLPTDLGHIIEGIVECDPMDGRPVIRTMDVQGRQIIIDPAGLLSDYEGQEVKLTLASLESIRQLQEVLESSGGAVHAVMPEDIEGATVNTTKKPS